VRAARIREAPVPPKILQEEESASADVLQLFGSPVEKEDDKQDQNNKTDW